MCDAADKALGTWKLPMDSTYKKLRGLYFVKNDCANLTKCSSKFNKSCHIHFICFAPWVVFFKTRRQSVGVLVNQHMYNVFHGFGQAYLVKIHIGGLILGSSQFSILPSCLKNEVHNKKMVKNNSKIIILLRQSKSVARTVWILFQNSTQFGIRGPKQDVATFLHV